MPSLAAAAFLANGLTAMSREEARPQYCYQVQDFTMPLPKQLEDLHMTCNVNHPREALVLAVHVLMTETGFELEGWQETLPDGGTKDHPASKNFFWERGDCLMKIGYSHPTCPSVSFLVAFVLFDSSLIVHGLVVHDNNTEGFSLNLRIPDFIQKAFLSDPEPNKVYKNLPTLSRLVKDSVALPLLGWAQCATNVAPTFGFMTLSSEIQLLILGYLNVRDLLAASRVSTDLFQLASHPVLWRKLFFKNFPSVEVSPTDNVLDWRERYKREYLLRKEHQEHALRVPPRMRLMPNPLRNAHRPFLLPPVPQLSDDDFDFDMFMPRPPRFSPPYVPQLPRRPPDPAFPRSYFGQYNVLPRGVLPHQPFGTGFGFL